MTPRSSKNSGKPPSSKGFLSSPSPQVSGSPSPHSPRRVNVPAPLSRAASKSVPSSETLELWRRSSKMSSKACSGPRLSEPMTARQSSKLMTARQSSKAVDLDPESGLDREWVEMMEKNWRAMQAKRRTLARLEELQQESGHYVHGEPNQHNQPEGMAESRTERFQASSGRPKPRRSGSESVVEDVLRVSVTEAEDDEAEEDDDFLSYKGNRLHQRLAQRFLIEQERGRRRSRQQEASERSAAKTRYNRIQDMKKTIAQQLEHLEQDRLQAEERRAAIRRQANSTRSSKASAYRDAPSRRGARAAAPVAGSPRRLAPAVLLPRLGVHRADQEEEPAAAPQGNAPWQEVPPPPPDLEPGLPTTGVLARRPIMWSMGHTQEWISAVTGTAEEAGKDHVRDSRGATRGRSPPRAILPRLAGQESDGSVLAVAERDRELSRRHRLQAMGDIAVEVRRFRCICA